MKSAVWLIERIKVIDRANQEIQRANQDQQDILEAVENAKNEVENY